MSLHTEAQPEPIPDIRRFRITAFVLGWLAGMVSALLGVGAGLILAPALPLMLRLRRQYGAATSLAVTIPTAAVAAYRYHTEALERGGAGLELPVVLWLSLGGVIGGIGGAVLGSALRLKRWRPLFGLALALLGAVMMATRFHLDPRIENVAGVLAVGLLVGGLSSIMGIGGGAVMVPALVLLLGYGQANAHATSLAVIAPVSLFATLIHLLRGNVVWSFAAWLSAGAALGVWVIAGLTPGLPDQTLRIIFAVFLIGLGLSMLRKQAVEDGGAADATPGPEDR